MKTWTQTSNSGFRGKIDFVSAGVSAKRARLSRKGGFSHVREVKSSLFTRPSPAKRAGLPPYKHPL